MIHQIWVKPIGPRRSGISPAILDPLAVVVALRLFDCVSFENRSSFLSRQFLVQDPDRDVSGHRRMTNKYVFLRRPDI